MNKEMQYIARQITDAYEGDPWFGRNAKALLSEVNEQTAFEKPNGQHSMVELVWHMVNWREFVISRFTKDSTKDINYFEVNDWRALDHSDKALLQQGLQRLHQTQAELLEVIGNESDALLDKNVEERSYTFRKLLHGILQHDIYHLGQIAYLQKLLTVKQ